MNRKIAAPLLVVALLGGAAWWYVSNSDNGAEGSVLYGNIDIRQVDLSFAVDGKIAVVAVDEGDPIAAGQELARLDDAPYRHAVAQAEANAAQAAALLAKTEAGNRAEDIAAARARLAEARARVVNAEAVLNRRRSLAREDAVSKQALDDAERDVTVARAASSARQSELDLAEKGFRIEDIDAARAAAAAAAAQLDQARYRLEQTRLVAPAAGTILTRAREPGAVVGAGAPVLSLALASPVWVRTYVEEPYLGRVAPGTKVTVRTDDPAGRSYAGTIGFVSPTAEFTPKAVETPELRTDLVYRLRVIVDDPDSGLRQGMPVTVTLNN
ncbi:MAG: secretion protein HlyD [Rhodospirillaceae bacterium]|nr:secretion protein HlyD [Rhodospirillaceae bacterium]